MYLPRELISHLYTHLVRTHHAQSPAVVILVALETDALCACRILTALLKRDFIAHNIQPVSGYGDLARAGETQVQPMRTQNGGSGGTVICLGVGGLVDLSALLGLESADDSEDPTGGVEIWVIDARRPWNLNNVFGGSPSSTALVETDGNARARLPEVSLGRIHQNYWPGKGGIIVFDDGDIDEDLAAERTAFFALEQMPEIEDEGEESDCSSSGSDQEGASRPSKKRKSWSDVEENDESEDEDLRPRQRRRNSIDGSSSPSPTRPARRGLLLPSNKNALDSSNAFRSGSPSSRPSSPMPTKQPSPRTLRRRLLRMKRNHEAVFHAYYNLGASYSEPISSLLYSLAEELGREDNDLLWHAIVGVSSLELSGRGMTGIGIGNAIDSGAPGGWGGERGERIRQVLRDEVRRLNPPNPKDDARSEIARGEASGVIPTTARSPTDDSIRLSPEPRFLLIRHWSLYDSMLHSPYLAAKLHIWSDSGRKRLHKLLAKMGVSLTQCKQNYTHMDMDLKRSLRQKLLKYAPMYSLEGLVPPPATASHNREGWGFVRSWGWKACLSAVDVGVIIGALLEVGKKGFKSIDQDSGWDRNRGERSELVDEEGKLEGEEFVSRFWDAYDALENVESLKQALPTALHLHRAILRTGTSLLAKHQIRHLRAFRMAVVKEGPDVQLFTHPSALTKLALWVGEAIAEQEREKAVGKRGTPLVLADLHEARGVYVVVGVGGGGAVDWEARKERNERKAEKTKAKEAKKAEREKAKAEKKEAKRRKRAAAEEDGEDPEAEETSDEEESEDDGSDADSEDDEAVKRRGYGKNRFGNAFQEVVDETGARVRIDSFDHCVVEVKKEDLGRFLEALSERAVVG